MDTKSIFDMMFNEDFMNLTVREMCEKFDCSIEQSKGFIKIKFKCPKFRLERNRPLRNSHPFATCKEEGKWTTDSCRSYESQPSLLDVAKSPDHTSDDDGRHSSNIDPSPWTIY